MKKLAMAMAALLSLSSVFAQVKNTAYRSSSYTEMVWSKSQDQYITVETVQRTSKFVFTEQGIYFMKGESQKWLYNDWTFVKTDETGAGDPMDIYKDERGQKIVIYYKGSEVWYFHGYDPNSSRYGNLTIYKDCVEDKALIQELAKQTKKADTENKSMEKFRIDCTMVSVYDGDTKKWSEWKDGLNTFIVNANANGDIIHITATGKEKLYRRTSVEVERDKTDNGKPYQIIFAIDENGDRFRFQLFDDVKTGVKMIYGNVAIQFSKQ